MSNVAVLERPAAPAPSDPLARLREPFAPNHISKLPKPTKQQTDEVKADFKKGIRCAECGSWHHPQVVHLDYVGHAALTDRLLDVDAGWYWEPLAFRDGLPAFDNTGGLWIKLTVCGVTRLGYGHAAAKPNQDPGAREKEVIGDALRNAAMRFGAALDLWHKGDLHADEPAGTSAAGEDSDPLWVTAAMTAITCINTEDEAGSWYKANVAMLREQPKALSDKVLAYLKERKAAVAAPAKTAQAAIPLTVGTDGTPFDDEIPF